MNKKIKDLADIAWQYACDNTPDDGSIMMESVYDFKYAELIIRECAAVTDAAEDSTPHLTFGDHLLSHFGIEK